MHPLHFNLIKILGEAAVHSGHGKVIRHDFKPRSIKRFIDLWVLLYEIACNHLKVYNASIVLQLNKGSSKYSSSF
jgi:hypothetical protein